MINIREIKDLVSVNDFEIVKKNHFFQLEDKKGTHEIIYKSKDTGESFEKTYHLILNNSQVIYVEPFFYSTNCVTGVNETIPGETLIESLASHEYTKEDILAIVIHQVKKEFTKTEEAVIEDKNFLYWLK